MKSSYAKVATASERIKMALSLRNMKQVELSEKSGINKPSISCYVSGKYEPKQSALYDLGKALDVSEMWLAGYDVPMERPVMQKNNDTLADVADKLFDNPTIIPVIQKLLDDPEFLSLVEVLSKYDTKKIIGFKQMLDSFQ